MADFRDQIGRLHTNNRKDELIDILSDKLGEKTTSVNPLTEAMFERIAPNYSPRDYAQESENYAEDWKPVKKNATALKFLLHKQVGRPLYERVLTLKKRDFAECITAIDAYESGQKRGTGEHIPTSLPDEADDFVSDPPRRKRSTSSSFDTIVELTGDYQKEVAQWLDQNSNGGSSPYFVYVLDCTPDTGENESEKVRNLRCAVETKITSGISRLDVKERAAKALNDDQHIYYVGSTNNITDRLRQHDIGTAASGVDFTTNFSPKQLVEIQTCSSRSTAESLEGERARELDDREGLFAYSDEM
ncbi:GIY-YIG nuclease family protein [Halorussus litoreus]|uniref:GIY-YIG nuclease family protein n=1 Tax=Halorussus litoreus TaxID=1710536 RepID=UPI000E278905|nr:GIY-YIG nuclease family protein [Halorussus litoreus]